MIFFRVLYSQFHHTGWNGVPVANSSHHRPPTAWIETWTNTGKTDDLDINYPLFCIDNGYKVKFTARARQTFLADPAKDYSNSSQNSETYAVGELDGVCAFSSVEHCLKWVSMNPGSSQNANNYTYVVFEGEDVCYDPEDGGRVVQVIKKGGPQLNLQTFKEMRDPLKLKRFIEQHLS